MVSRILLACMACLLAVASVQAEPTVFFRGKELTYRHYVYGEVTSCAKRAGTINLGYGHGIESEQQVGVLRLRGGNLVPIGLMTLTHVRPGESFGVYDGEFSLQPDDVVIVAARNLNVWQGQSRSDHLVRESMLTRSNRGYDTGDVTPALLDELGRDDNLIQKKEPPLHVNADIYSTRRPFIREPVARGAFRLATGDLDGAVNSLSVTDRELSPDSSTLQLQMALARYVSTSSSGKLAVDDNAIRQLANELPGRVDMDEVVTNLNRAHIRVSGLIRLK